MAEKSRRGMQWIARLRHASEAGKGEREGQGAGERRVFAQLIRTAEVPEVRTAWIEGRLDAEDEARMMMAFRGQPHRGTAGNCSAYLCDEESGMVYLRD